ncbi:MAG: phosphoribosylamine--glycine ligase [Candidatus Gracilibacteria bacterium]
MKKILLIGNGAREHCIAETLKRSPQVCELFVYGKAVNPGIKSLAGDYKLGALNDLPAILEFAQMVRPDFAVIGPEDPLADGVADALLGVGVPSVGPVKTLARLESSKSFTRDLLTKYSITGNPKYRTFTDGKGLRDFLVELGDYVVKADGLMGGKGVKLSGEHLHSVDEGVSYALECISLHGHVVIEEKFVGEEFSLMSFCDGFTVVDMPAVQDHKRAFAGDTGPNTGGMGTYSNAGGSLPFLTASDLAEAHAINQSVCDALFKETGERFKGIMYGGFIATAKGVRLIEYNARFGDPECMNVLPILKTDFIAICEAIIEGTLGGAGGGGADGGLSIEFEDLASVVKYVCPEGYPENPVKNVKVEVGEMPSGSGGLAGVRVYFASIDAREDATGESGLYMLGSRAIAVTGIAKTLAEAERLAEAGAKQISGPVFFRSDIGTAELIGKRVLHMKELRGA